MALFGGQEILDAWTPDGRQTRQPRSIVDALGLSTTPPQVGAALPRDIITPTQGPNTAIGAAPMAGGIAPQPAPVEQPDPYRDTVRAQFSPTPAVDAGTVAPPPKQPVSPAGVGEATPQQKPLTNAQLVQGGNAAAFNDTSAALDKQKAAEDQLADQKTREMMEVANVHARSEERAVKNLEEIARTQKEHADAIGQSMAKYDQGVEALAKRKVDRKADHPILAAIAVALGAVGSAMSGKKDGSNPALDMLFRSIDRKVAGQLSDMDKQRGDLALQKDRMGMQRVENADRMAEVTQRTDAELKIAKTKLDEIAARSSSEQVKTMSMVIGAKIDEKRAELRGTFADREDQKLYRDKAFEQQKQQHRDSIRMQGAGLAQNERHFNKSFGEGQRQFDARMAMDEKRLLADQNTAIMAARAKGNEERAKELTALQKENRESGVSDVRNGERLLQPEGQKMMDEAARIEAEAVKFKEKGSMNVAAQIRAKALDEKAAQLRGEAQTVHQFRARNSTEAIEVGSMISDTQDAITLIDEIKALGPNKSVIGQDKYEQALKSKAKLLTLTLKEAYKTGTLDDGSVRILDQITGGDPTKVDINTVTTFLGNAAGTEGSLEAVAQSLEKRVQNRLKTAGDGYKGVWKATRPKPLDEADKASDVIRSYTPSVTAAADDAPSFARELVENSIPGVGHALEYSRKATTASAERNESNRHFGLPNAAAAKVDELLAMRGTKMGKSADAVLLGMATDKDPAMRAAGLRVLRENAPDLYEQALKSAPADVRQAEGDLSTLANRQRRF